MDNIGDFLSTQLAVASLTARATGSNGVHAQSSSNDAGAIYGEHLDGGIGVFGRGGPAGGDGVFGQTASHSSGVYGKNSVGGPGVVGESATGYGVVGNGGDIGVYAHNSRTGQNRNDVYLATRGLAGDFHGDLYVHGTATVTGDILLTGADYAEDFDLSSCKAVEPGTVMVLTDHGGVGPSEQPYDKRVAGVVSGAGGYRPGMILDRRDPTGRIGQSRTTIALLGKVMCKIDADVAPVEVGDLLATSPTPGHAMKVGDASEAFGAVLGKAMAPLARGRGLVPILIALQ